MTSPRRLLLLAASLAGAMLAGGCGYTMDPMHRTDIKTVYVSAFTRGKDVYRRDLEFQLTEALVKRIQQDTPYRIVDKAKADSHITGTLDLVPQRVLRFNPDTGMPTELEVTLVVSFTWTDLRSGKMLVNKKSIKETATYLPQDSSSSPFSETFFTGSEDVINRMARKIVQQMERDDW